MVAKQAIRAVSVVFVALWFATGCVKDEKPDPTLQRLKRVVTKYNYALIDAYRIQAYEELKKVASPEELRRVGIIVSSYLQADQIMDARLRSIEFRRIVVDGDTARVDTEEEWAFRWLNRRTGNVVEPLREIHYRMRYHLVKDPQRGWLVERLEKLSSTLREPTDRKES